MRFLIPGNDSRPADVLLPHWKAGKDVALDVAVVNPCKGGTVVEAAAAAGYALNDTFKSKMQKAAEACQREGVIFLPMVTESFGGWHEVAVTEVEFDHGYLSFFFPELLILRKPNIFLLQIFKCQTFLCRPEMSTVVR